jgi:hypothetical protein
MASPVMVFASSEAAYPRSVVIPVQTSPLQNSIKYGTPACDTDTAEARVLARIALTKPPNPSTVALLAELAGRTLAQLGVPPQPPASWIDTFPKQYEAFGQTSAALEALATCENQTNMLVPSSCIYAASLGCIVAQYYEPASALSCYYQALYNAWEALDNAYNQALEAIEAAVLLFEPLTFASYYNTINPLLNLVELTTPCNPDGDPQTSYLPPPTIFAPQPELGQTAAPNVSALVFPEGVVVASTLPGRDTCAQVLYGPIWTSSLIDFGLGVQGSTATGEVEVGFETGFPISDIIPYVNGDQYAIFEYGVLYVKSGMTPARLDPLPNAFLAAGGMRVVRMKRPTSIAAS